MPFECPPAVPRCIEFPTAGIIVIHNIFMLLHVFVMIVCNRQVVYKVFIYLIGGICESKLFIIKTNTERTVLECAVW